MSAELEPRDLRRHAEPQIDDARIDRQWAAIEAALPEAGRSPARGRAWAFPVAALAIAAAVAVMALRDTAPGSTGLTAGARVASEERPITMRLDDDSSLQLSAHSELKLQRSEPDAVELSLERGHVRFDVNKRPSRRFEVRAGNVTVRVVGTRFDVSRRSVDGDTRVEVSVERGVVEVLRAGNATPMRIGAGERWSTDEPSLPAPSEPARAVDEDEAAETTEAVEEPVDDDAPSARQPTRRRVSAQELFNRASLSRRAGSMQEAAEAYAELLERHPDDARAGLSAFELGRIRMDALRQPDAAIDAFQQALRLSPSAAFHEDALARIAIAHDNAGRAAACEEARARYLARYPDGVHATVLASRCGEQ